MATLTISSIADVFPVGTSVGAYPLSGYPTSSLPPAGSPPVSATNSGTVASDGSLAVTGLADGTRYFLGASVSGAWRFRSVRTADAAGGGVPVTSQTVSYTPVLGDANSVIRMNSSSATTFTVPPNSSVGFAVGTLLEVHRTGSGTVTLVAGSGVTINKTASVLTIAAQYGVVSLLQVATDTWNLVGGLG